jgi:hypothetical protein
VQESILDGRQLDLTAIWSRCDGRRRYCERTGTAAGVGGDPTAVQVAVATQQREHQLRVIYHLAGQEGDLAPTVSCCQVAAGSCL